MTTRKDDSTKARSFGSGSGTPFTVKKGLSSSSKAELGEGLKKEKEKE
jgi:hypothetical protein